MGPGARIGHLVTHAIVVTTGSAGDLFPFLKLAASLRGRGMTVTLVAPQLHEEQVRASGLDFHGTVCDLAVLSDPDVWHPRRGFGVIWRAVRPGLRELGPIVAAVPAGQPSLIVAHPLALPEALLCRQLRPDVRVVAAYLAPSNLVTVHDPLMLGPYRVPRWVPLAMRRWLWKQIFRRLVDPVVMPDINADRARAGVAPAASLADLMRDGPDLSVTLFPRWLAEPKPDWPAPLVCGDFALFDPNPDAPVSAELKAFIAAGEAPLIFTHGTANRQADDYFAQALEATIALGKRAIFLTPHREQVAARLPSTILWQSYVPLRALLPHAAVLIHHGGIGTTAEALRAGIPQLILPLAYDQFDNAMCVQQLGVGLVLSKGPLTANAQLGKLAHVAGSATIRARCDAVSKRFDSDDAWERSISAISKTVSKTGNN